jgi:arylsulfatase A-like enzyme
MNARVSPSETMLTGLLRGLGYRTAGFVGGPFLNPEYGFAKGFDVYNAGGWRYFRETLPPALDWIRDGVHKKEKAPFFLFVHGNDVHPPFNPALPEATRRRFDPDYKGPADDLLLDYYFVRVFNRSPWSGGPPPDDAYIKKVEEIRADPRSIPHISALYDGQVSQVDEAFEKLWRTLDEEGLLQNTIIVLLADHGLELGERGLLGTGYHTVGLETITHVPLIFWGPGIAPGKNSDVAQLIDVAPTLLALIGAPAQPLFEGTALRPGAPEHAALGESTVVGGDGSIPLFYLRDPRWKLIYRLDGPVSELYDLTADPRETNDVSKANAAAARGLVEKLLQRTSSTKP